MKLIQINKYINKIKNQSFSQYFKIYLTNTNKCFILITEANVCLSYKKALNRKPEYRRINRRINKRINRRITDLYDLGLNAGCL